MVRTITIDDSAIEARLDAADRSAQQLAGQQSQVTAQLQALAARLPALEQRLQEISRVRLTACEANIIDHGCRANDPSFDNGPPLNALFRRLGGNPQDGSWLPTSLYVPAGGWYFKMPLDTPAKTGLRIRGNGLAHVLNENSYWSPNTAAMGGPASRLIYTGDPKQPAIQQRGLGEIWDGIVLQRGPQPNARDSVVTDGSIGFELSGQEQPPQGKIEYRSIAVLGFETAIHTKGGAGGHADESEVGFAWVQDCRTVFRSDCPQSTCWHFRKLMVAGKCETVFDWQSGGGMSCEHLSLMAPALVFRLREPMEHLSSFRISYLKIDAGPSKGWRLVEATRAWLLRLSVWGEIGKGAAPGQDAVSIRGPAGRQWLDISLVDGNTCTLWDWRADAKLEDTT